MRSRATVVLLLLAALLGAPPRASAATNQLLDPVAGPTSGSVATVFTFRVRYEGSFPAVAVTTTVAGLTLPMVRTAGTASSGTWTATSALPSGTWQPTFSAVATQANQPTLAGPSVVVTELAPTVEPTAAPTDVTPVEGVPGGSGRAAPADGGTAPIATSAPAAPAATDAPVAAATPIAAPTGTVPGSGTSVVPSVPGAAPGSDPDAGPGSDPDAAPGSDPGDGGTDAGAGLVPPGATSAPDGAGVAASTRPTPGGSGGPRGSEPSGHGLPAGLDGGDPGATSQVGMVLVIGLSGVAAVALVGLAVLLARRRREATSVRAVASSESQPEPLRRRSSRLAGIELPDDPIVAALGLGRDDPQARRQRNRPPD